VSPTAPPSWDSPSKRAHDSVITELSLSLTGSLATIPPWIRRRDSGQSRRPPRVIGARAEAAFEAAADAACHRYDLEVHGMIRQNLFSDGWDGDDEEDGTRHRIFWRPDDARMGATLYELAPNASGGYLHMHFGAEEMFFVLSGRPVFRNQHGEEKLAPGEVRLLPRGTCRTTHVQQPHRRTRSDPCDQCRELPGCRRLPRTRICMGGDSRSRSRAIGERRRPRHHRSLRDPDRVDRSAVCRPSLDWRAASQPKEIRWYDSGHFLPPQAWCDAARFLGRQIGIAGSKEPECGH
jgi:mannose-6-phosphate isomerase-like protein (cupin superfamily)